MCGFAQRDRASAAPKTRRLPYSRACARPLEKLCARSLSLSLSLSPSSTGRTAALPPQRRFPPRSRSGAYRCGYGLPLGGVMLSLVVCREGAQGSGSSLGFTLGKAGVSSPAWRGVSHLWGRHHATVVCCVRARRMGPAFPRSRQPRRMMACFSTGTSVFLTCHKVIIH